MRPWVGVLPKNTKRSKSIIGWMDADPERSGRPAGEVVGAQQDHHRQPIAHEPQQLAPRSAKHRADQRPAHPGDDQLALHGNPIAGAPDSERDEVEDKGAAAHRDPGPEPRVGRVVAPDVCQAGRHHAAASHDLHRLAPWHGLAHRDRYRILSGVSEKLSRSAAAGPDAWAVVSGSRLRNGSGWRWPRRVRRTRARGSARLVRVRRRLWLGRRRRDGRRRDWGCWAAGLRGA
jgi:hypothetical protein